VEVVLVVEVEVIDKIVEINEDKVVDSGEVVVSSVDIERQPIKKKDITITIPNIKAFFFMILLFLYK